MTNRGRPLDAWTVARIKRLAAAGVSVRRGAREAGVAPMTYQKYKRPAG